MQTHPLGLQAQAETGANTLVVVTYVDFSALSSNTGTLALATVAAKQGARVAFAKLVTPFSGSDATLASIAGTIGDGGSATKYLTSTELTTNGGTTPVYLKGGVQVTNSLNVYTVDDTIDLFLTGTAAKVLSTCTAGELHVYLFIADGRS